MWTGDDVGLQINLLIRFESKFQAFSGLLYNDHRALSCIHQDKKRIRLVSWNLLLKIISMQFEFGKRS